MFSICSEPTKNPYLVQIHVENIFPFPDLSILGKLSMQFLIYAQKLAWAFKRIRYNSYNNQYVKSKMSSSDEQFVTSLMTKVMNHRQLVAPFSLDGLCVGNFSLNGS